MLFLESTIGYVPGRLHRFLEVAGAEMVPLVESSGLLKLWGAWHTPVGAGNGSEANLIWTLPDWGAWAEFQAWRKRDPRLPDWRIRAREVIERRFSRVLEPSPGMPERVDLPEPGAHGHVLYYEEIVQFEPGIPQEDYWERFRNVLVPLEARDGMRLVGTWHTAPGSGHGDEVTFLWVIRDWAAWGEMREKHLQDPPTRDWAETGVKWRRRWFTKLLIPTPWSPLR
jgi:hypothetical protein